MAIHLNTHVLNYYPREATALPAYVFLAHSLTQNSTGIPNHQNDTIGSCIVAEKLS